MSLEVLSLPEERMLSRCFSFTGIDRKVADARVFTDEHAAVNRIAGSDEEDAAFFEHLQRVGSGGAGIHRNERAGGAVLDFTGVRARIP